MIRCLEIRGLVVIDHAELEFGPGLTVITGETGAGKTVLTNALGLLGTMPPDSGMVRPGHRHALIQATVVVGDRFWDELDANDPASALADVVEDPHEFVLTRRIPADGRARSFADGTAVPHAAVAGLIARLVRFSGQGDQRQLTSPRAQRQALDRFCGPATIALATEVAALRRAYRVAARRHAEAQADRARRDREREDLGDLVAQLDAIAPEPGEAVRLRAERDRLRHADRLVRAVAEAAEALAPDLGEIGARELVGQAERALGAVVEVDAALVPAAELLRDGRALIDEASVTLRRYLASMDADPRHLDIIESRLVDLERLARRAGCELESLSERADEVRAELAVVRADAHDDVRFEEAQAEMRADIVAAAARLADARHTGGDALAVALRAALEELAMPDATVRVVVSTPDDPLDAESIQVLLQPNAGLAEAPLADVASGGELSRVLLALHGLAAGDDDATWVFDEIDAGIGGVTAGAVARRLADLGRRTQTVVITHLAAVAAVGDVHLVLNKDPGGSGVAEARIEVVTGEDRVAELCRMLGATPDDSATRGHAERLLADAAGR